MGGLRRNVQDRWFRNERLGRRLRKEKYKRDLGRKDIKKEYEVRLERKG